MTFCTPKGFFQQLAKQFPLNSKGISVLFLVIAMMLMVSIGYVFSYLIPTKQKSVSLAVSSNQAFFLAQSGVEFAVRYATDQGWTTKPALNGLDNMTRDLGRGRFILDYDEPNDRLISTGQIPNASVRRIAINNFTSFLITGITYFSSASTPPDGGANNSPITAVIPPANMLAGDLVLMIGLAKDNAGTLEISNPGGQSWTTETQQNQTNCRIRLFWCRFNGTWSANPSINFNSNNNNTLVMHVFRSSDTSSPWIVDVAQVSGNYSAPVPPYTVIIPGITTITNNALVFAVWASTDNNTWGNLTAGWSTPGSAQYRNNPSGGASQSHAYKVMATAGASGNVSKDQLTLGGDAGAYLIIAFRQ